MGLPPPKVANVPGIANQRWPACLQGHDRIIDPDGKQDGGALLAFPRQGRFYLLLHPLACHRRLGQNDEQLVIEADCLINAGAESVADFHVLGSKPAPHALVLEIGIQSFGEVVVLTRIADEAGVELEGLIEQRGQVVNQRVWQTAAPKKGQR